jgi:hypothetical protein
MILCDFCFLSSQFCYITIYVRKFESHVQIADQCAPWKGASGAENFVLQTLEFHEMFICCKFPGRVSVSHCRPNKYFVEGRYNVSA